MKKEIISNADDAFTHEKLLRHNKQVAISNHEQVYFSS